MKKQILVFCTSLLSIFFLNAQTNTFPPSGNVGIGTVSPSAELEVKGGDGVGISLYNDQANYWDIINSQYGKLDFVRGKSDIFMRITQNGYVGIGTTTPSHLFSLGNNSNTSNLFKVDGSYSDVLFNGTHTNGNIWSFVNTGTGEGTRFYVQDANNSSSRLTFDFKGNNGSINILAGTSSGNVGIGTSNPTEKLYINEGNINVFGYNSSRYLRFTEANLQGAFINYDGTNNVLKIGVNNINSTDTSNDYNAINILRSTGNVGIGTTNPLDKLQITNSYVFHDGGHKVLGFLYSPSGAIDLDNTKHAAELRFDPGLGNLRLGISSTITNAPTTHMTITKEGYIGIGTTNPGIWKLAVNGNIRAKEIKVETGWSDFVFENSYNLPTLKEVEQHIKDKGHLKDIPSAEEVKENGIFLGEMDSKLLQKIEELTLYTIEQQKEIENSEKEIKAQNKKIEKLEKENEELQSLSKRLAEIEKLLNAKKQ